MPPSANGTYFVLEGLEQVCGNGQGPVGALEEVLLSEENKEEGGGHRWRSLCHRGSLHRSWASPEGEGRVAFRPLPHCPAEPAFWTKSQNNEFFHITRWHQVVRWERGFSPDPFPDFLRKGYLKTWFSFCRLPASGFCRNSSLKVPVCIQEGPEGGEALVPPTSGAADKDSHCYSSFSLNGRLHRKLVWWLTTWMRHS